MHAPSRGGTRRLRRVAVLAASLATVGALLPAPAFAAPPAEVPVTPATDATITGQDGSAFGSTASQVSCDFTGNGVPDLAVGKYADFGAGPTDDAATVLIDASSITESTDVSALEAIHIFDSASNFMGGVDIRCAGDVNGDGIDDLIAVAQASGVFVIYGSRDISDLSLDALGDRGVRINGSVTRGNGIGDIDADGLDEVAVTDTSGVVTILKPTQLPAVSTLASAPGPRVSAPDIDLVSISNVGDVNGDGRADLAVGAASWTAPGSTGRGTGAIWVITDLSTDVTIGADPIPGFRIDGPPRGYDLLGTSTVGLGDIDGDGFDDLLIGGESDDPLTGSAVVVRGGPDQVNIATNPLVDSGFAVRDATSGEQRGWWITGLASGDHFGHAVGAVRRAAAPVLLVGGMDGSPDPALEGSGYALALDARVLTQQHAAVSATGTVEAASFLSKTLAAGDGGQLIAGQAAEQRLGRSFADLTVDPTSARISFAIGAPALFSWQQLPAVRIMSTDVVWAAAEEPGTGEPGTGEPGTGEPGTGEPGTGEPGTEVPGVDGPSTEAPSTDGASTDGSNTEAQPTASASLATTGAAATPLTLIAAAIALVLGAAIGVFGAVRARKQRATHEAH